MTGPAALGFAALRSGGLGLPGLLSRRRLLGLLGRAGLAALLAMLNSCASGCSVVNIDNGFGAGYLASMINQMEGLEEQ